MGITYLYTPKCKSMESCPFKSKGDSKVFSKNYKTQLLDSIVNDPAYVVNNAYDYIYKL